jgi:hypothetical protein
VGIITGSSYFAMLTEPIVLGISSSTIREALGKRTFCGSQSYSDDYATRLKVNLAARLLEWEGHGGLTLVRI